MLAALSLVALAATPDLTTVAERSKLTRTGRYEEVARLCRDYPAAYPGRVACLELGVTPEGRPMLALVASEDGALSPELAAARRRPVIFVQGGIHAGEIDGKDAGFMALRAMLDGRAAKGALAAVTWVFVPVFNVDGHERFGAHNRPNQRGPEEMGWRVTAQGYNLNRDYTKADAPEMQAMLRALGAWDPVLYADLHVTDGADFQHDIAVILDPAEAGPEALRAHGRALRGAVLDKLSKQGNKPLPYYPAFEVDDDPASGFSTGRAPPRFALGYWAERDRLSMLVETHSWKPYAVRVEATRRTLIALAEEATLHAREWREAADAQDRESLAGKPVTVSWDAGERVGQVDFLAYAYERTPSAVSGGLRTSYDPRRPVTLKLPFKDELLPKLTITAPRAGYYVPGWATAVLERLALHGFRFERTQAPRTLELEVHRATEHEHGKASYEGRQTLTVKGEWRREKVELPAGTAFVPIDQPGGRLLVHLLEPGAPDSFLAWGFFNTRYEQKEYMEDYVAEQLGAEALAKDPKLRAEFNAKLAAPKFAADPKARLEFFYRRHPSWDDTHQKYPVMRAELAPPTK